MVASPTRRSNPARRRIAPVEEDFQISQWGEEDEAPAATK
jgi:chaperone required for assembly of F1-ATPase